MRSTGQAFIDQHPLADGGFKRRAAKRQAEHRTRARPLPFAQQLGDVVVQRLTLLQQLAESIVARLALGCCFVAGVHAARLSDAMHWETPWRQLLEVETGKG